MRSSYFLPSPPLSLYWHSLVPLAIFFPFFLLHLGGCVRVKSPLPNPTDFLSTGSSISTAAYVEEEDRYAKIFFSHYKTRAFQIYESLKELSKDASRVPPIPIGRYRYWIEVEQGLRFPLYFRENVETKQREVWLDLNSICVSIEKCDLGTVRQDSSGKRVALTLDRTGRGVFNLYLWQGGILLPLPIEHVVDCEWSRSGETLFFTTEERGRPKELSSLVLDSLEVLPLYKESDESFWLSIKKSSPNGPLLVRSFSETRSKIFLVNEEASVPELRSISPCENCLLDVVNSGDGFYVLEENERILRVKGGHLSEVYTAPARTIRMIASVNETPFFVERDNGEEILKRITYGGVESIYKTSSPAESLQLLPSTDPLLFSSSLPFRPKKYFSFDGVQLQELNERKAEHFKVSRLDIRARDGTSVPVTIAGASDGKPHPLLLLGYGAYGVPYPSGYSPFLYYLLSRGFTIAIAHVRGGGELGRSWHEGGRGLKKLNSFNDFIDVGDAMITMGYALPEKLFARGKSAGALLVAGSALLKPNLFRAIVLESPFLDPLAPEESQLSSLRVREFDEWGDPAREDVAAYLKKYSPQELIKRSKLPSGIIFTSLNDEVVSSLQTLRWIATARTRAGVDLYLNVSREGTHGGERSEFKELQSEALKAAYLEEIGLQ